MSQKKSEHENVSSIFMGRPFLVFFFDERMKSGRLESVQTRQIPACFLFSISDQRSS